jgi:tetratricopeptide (TPR) repeat protein
VVAFPPLRETQDRLARALEQNADDARALEQRGRLNLQLGRRQRGMEDLRRAIALKPTAEAKQTLAALLLEELRLDQANLESTIRELDTLVDDPKQRLMFARLRAHSLQQRGEHLAAARELLKVADAWEPDNELQHFGDKVAARQDRWLAARLSELRELMSATDRDVFDVELKTRLKTASGSTGHLSLRRYVALFDWHDATSANARRALVDRLDSKKHRHEVEANLLSLRRSGAIEHQAFATARFAQQWLAAGQTEMTRSLLDELSGPFADVRSLDNKTGRELAEGWKTEFREKLKITWPTKPLQSQRIDDDAAISKSYRIEWVGPADPLREHWQLELDPLRVIVARDSVGRIVWKWKPPVEEYAQPHVVGHYACGRGRWLVLVLGGEFFVTDTLVPAGEEAAPRLLWQGVLTDRRVEQTTAIQPQSQQPPIAGIPTSYVMIDNTGRRLGRVMIVGDDVLCVQSGTRLMALRLATGDLLWTHDGVPVGSEISGDARAVVATSADRREALVLNTLDGRILARREFGSAMKIAAVGRQLVTWASFEDGHELRLIDAVTNTELLRERFALGAKPCVSLRETVAVMDAAGRFVMWSLPDGRKLLDQTVAAIPYLRHLLVMQDRERWLLMTYTEEPPVPNKLRTRVSELSFDQWRVRGPCLAFSRSTGKLLWSAELDWQAVNAAQPADSPVLLLAAKVFRPSAAETPLTDGLKYKVDVLDKRNGRLMTLADELLRQRFEFCEQRPDLDGQLIEVQVERMLYQLSFSETPPKKKVSAPE